MTLAVGVGARSGILVILCMMAACSVKDDSGKSAKTSSRQRLKPAQATVYGMGNENFFASAARTGVWYPAGAYRVRSLVPGVSVAPLPDLPVIAYKKDANDFCGEDYPTQHTPEGKWARSRGWRIGDEIVFGPVTIVNVLRRYYYEAQACNQIDGGAVLFDHGRPIAAIHVGKPDDTLQVEELGDVEKGALRLKNRWVKPFGDLLVKGHDIEIRPLPSTETLCGEAILPNVFGESFARARSILGRWGWKPDPVAAPTLSKDIDGNLYSDDRTASDLRKQGYTEVNNCNPMSFCEFHYRRGKIKVMLYTQGDEVVQHFEDCPTR